MNFLIAMISDTYARISTYNYYYSYNRKQDLNFESLLIMNHFGYLEDFNTLIILSNPELDKTQQQLDMTQKIKQFVQDQNNQIFKELESQKRVHQAT